MRDLLPFIVVGITSGALYALAAVGLVLTFRTSGIFNFAHGAVAAAAAYLFYDLHSGAGLPWPVAALISVVGLGPVLGVVIERITRPLAGARPVVPIVATTGLLLTVQGFLSWKYSPLTLEFPQFLPAGGVEVAGVTVQWAQLISVGVGVAAVGGLVVFLRSTTIGVAMRGVVDDPSLVGLAGLRPTRVRTAAWAIGSSFAALTGILVAPTLGRDPALLTLLVVQAFGAAAVGAFSSLVLTFAGGIGIGVASAVLTKYAATSDVFRQLPGTFPFLVLVGALVILPKRRLPTGIAARPVIPTDRTIPPRLAAAGAVLLGGALVAVPWLVGPKLPVYINAAAFVVVFLSLSLLVWTSQQISLCHAAFVALGATTFSHVTGAGAPWFVGLLAAGLATVPLGLLVALPAIRLSGLYLALATFGFGLLMQRVVFRAAFMFGETGLRSGPRPDLPLLGGQTDRSFYFVVLAVAAASCVAIVALVRSRLGRLLRGLGESPTALVTHGLSLNVTKLLVFSVSASLAGVAGALFVANTGQVIGDAFGPFQSLTWLAVLAICGSSVVPSSLAAAAVLAVLPSYAPQGFADYQTMLFGASAVFAAVTLSRSIRLGGVRTADRLRRSPVRARLADAAAPAPARPPVAASGT